MIAPAPYVLDEVLSPTWLTAALQQSLPGVVVAGTRIVETLESTAAKVRFVVTYDDDGGRPDVPTAFCVKGYFNPKVGKDRATGIHEAQFYQRLAAQVRIQVPPSHYAGVDFEDPHGLVIMEDVCALGATFFDQLDHFDLETARQSLTQLATLHGQFWDAPPASADGDEWLNSKILFFPAYIPTDILEELLQGPRADGLPDDMRRAERLKASMHALADRYAAKPKTIIHADAHLGNLYRMADGRIGFVDWQNYELGHWSMDVAYHLATALEPTVRAAHERELLEHYLGELARHGGPPISIDDAWDDYRAGAAYGYFMWAMTRRVVPAITEELARRAGRAVLDNASYAALGV
jgi:hypothetical protein